MPVDARPRAASPRVMCSTLITSAPQSLRMADAAGTKVWSARSRIRTPSMGRWVLMRWCPSGVGQGATPAGYEMTHVGCAGGHGSAASPLGRAAELEGLERRDEVD